MNILLTAIGKRVQLIKYLKKSCRVIGVDCSELAAASDFVDSFHIVPKYTEKSYIETLLMICEDESVDMLIPLYEKEFELLCDHKKEFDGVETILLLSSKEIIQSCNDKWKTYQFFRENNIKTPETFMETSVLEHMQFPLIIKPFDGMGSSNVFKAKDEVELNFFMKYVEKPIVQEFIQGKEYTIDVLCDLKCNPISIVPRERLEVRSGEVVKSRTVMDDIIIRKTQELCSKLKGIGPLTIQCIKDAHGDIYFIEINPRFGGGVPLTFEAGVDYGKLFCSMKAGKNIIPIIGEFKEITMLRFDEAVYR